MKQALVILLLFFGLFLSLTWPVQAADEEPVTLYFFWAKGCPHCQKEEIFLEKLVSKYPELEIKSLEVTSSQENLNLLQKVGEKLKIKIGGTPFTTVGENYIVGYLNDETSGRETEEAVICAFENHCQDIVAPLLDSQPSQPSEKQAIPETLKLPLIGQIKTKNLSLPLLTIIIGILDGFNPCAMWVLLFLISLLLGIENARRRWLLGITFIASSALVYFLFMAAWLNFFLFLGFIIWIRIIIGLVALGAGAYNIRDYWLNREGGCEAVSNPKREKIFNRLRKIAQKRELFLALGGIVLLALAVNLVELICSAGLPAVYTQILALNKLPSWQYYLYLLIYIFFFMIDDLLIFTIAMVTLQAVGIESKYARFSHLVGGIIMIAIGLSMLFKPEWLMFG